MHMIKFLINMENFIIQICMERNWSNFRYVMKLRFWKTPQTNSKEWNDVETFFHSNEMMSRLPFIRMSRYRDHLSFQSNEIIVLSFNFHFNWKHAKSSHPNSIRFISRRINVDVITVVTFHKNIWKCLKTHSNREKINFLKY